MFDTPTPPSQSYSHVYEGAGGGGAGGAVGALLQTSLKPRFAMGTTATATTTTNKTPFKNVTSTPGMPKSRLNERINVTDDDDEYDSTFTASELGGDNNKQQQHPTTYNGQSRYAGGMDVDDIENRRPAGATASRNANRSLGYGDAGRWLGLGKAEERERFADLDSSNRRQQQHQRRTTARVDEYSDVTDSSSTSSSAGRTRQRAAAARAGSVSVSASASSEDDQEDDVLSARLGLHRPTLTTTTDAHAHVQRSPFGAYGVSSNTSKSAFDGMARELRREFERIMDSGKKATPVAAIASGSSPSRMTMNYAPSSTAGGAPPSPARPQQQQQQAAQRYSLQPVAPATLHQQHHQPSSSLPRGVQPPSTSYSQAQAKRPITIPAQRPAPARADSTPTTLRTLPPQREQQQRPISPFHINPNSSFAPSSGILPPNNTRATGRSASPAAPPVQQQHQQGQPARQVQREHTRQASLSYAQPQSLAQGRSLRHESFSGPALTGINDKRQQALADSDDPYSYSPLRVPDITGLTEGLTSPSRATSGPSSHRELPHRHSSQNHGSPGVRSRHNSRPKEDPALSAALTGLRQRLEALETENARSEAKVAELEDKLEERNEPSAPRNTREDELVGALKAEIERLQGSIEQHSAALAQLQQQQQQQGFSALDAHRPANAGTDAYRRVTQSWTDEFLQLRDALTSLAEQVTEVKKVLEEVLQSVRRPALEQLVERGEVLDDPRDRELLRPGSRQGGHGPHDRPTSNSNGFSTKERMGSYGGAGQPYRERQPSARQDQRRVLPGASWATRHHSEPPAGAGSGYPHAPGYLGPLHAAHEHEQKQQSRPAQSASQPARAASAPPPAAIAHRVLRQPSYTAHPAAAPTVNANAEPLLDRAERILSTLPPPLDAHASAACEICRQRAASPTHGHGQDADFGNQDEIEAFESSHRADRAQPRLYRQPHQHPHQHHRAERAELPMQTVITRALRDLEDDFAVHKRIFIELSDEYKTMDPATPDVGKRRILASHLKESVDVLELKADEIKRLYDLLHYRGELERSQEADRIQTLAQELRQRYQ